MDRNRQLTRPLMVACDGQCPRGKAATTVALSEAPGLVVYIENE